MDVRGFQVGDWYYDVSICDDRDDPNDKFREARQVGSVEHFQYDASSLPVFRVNANMKHPRNWLPSTGDNIRLIELSEDILKKNGFVYREMDNAFVKSFGITNFTRNFALVSLDLKRVEIDNAGNNLSIRVLYVNELQHALRLCGLSEYADSFEI